MAKALIVHSEFLKKLVEEKSFPAAHRDPASWSQPLALRSLRRSRKELGFNDQDLVLLSTGYVTKNKRYEAIIPALNELTMANLKYVIIGQDEANYLKILSQDKSLTIIRKGYRQPCRSGEIPCGRRYLPEPALPHHGREFGIAAAHDEPRQTGAGLGHRFVPGSSRRRGHQDQLRLWMKRK